MYIARITPLQVINPEFPDLDSRDPFDRIIVAHAKSNGFLTLFPPMRIFALTTREPSGEAA